MIKRRSWAAGEVFPPGKRTKSWSVRYSNFAGRRRSKSGFTSGMEARRWLDSKKDEIAVARVGGHIADPKRLPTLRELSPEYLMERKATKRAGKEDASRWRVHLAPCSATRGPGRWTRR